MLPNYKKLSRYLRASEEDYSAMLKDKGIDISKVKDKLKGGKADKKQPTDFPLDQLEKGIEVEKEHTDDPYKAIEIAMDHLAEDTKYYTKLEKMEKKSQVLTDREVSTYSNFIRLNQDLKRLDELSKRINDEYGEYSKEDTEQETEPKNRKAQILPREELSDYGDLFFNNREEFKSLVAEHKNNIKIILKEKIDKAVYEYVSAVFPTYVYPERDAYEKEFVKQILFSLNQDVSNITNICEELIDE